MKKTVLLLSVLLSSCSPLSSEHLAEAMKALAQDHASFCLQAGGGAGAGALTIGPAIPVGGGYGYLYVGRSNESNSTVTVDKDGCKIEHGKK